MLAVFIIIIIIIAFTDFSFFSLTFSSFYLLKKIYIEIDKL